jgi:hypothetical protein
MTSPSLSIPKNLKPYTVAILFPGPNYDTLSDRSAPANLALQAEHLQAVCANVEAGLQILAAPVMTSGSSVSAFSVFHANVPTEQVNEIMQRDPAIVAGRFIFQVHQVLFPDLDGVKMEY